MKVVLVMGSTSDKKVMKKAADALDRFEIEGEARGWQPNCPG